jgi:hypothetical protein
MNKILVVMTLVVIFSGCLEISNDDEVPSIFITENFRIGDEITYELWGKMLVTTNAGFLDYKSIGDATIEIKQNNIKDASGNVIDVIDFYVQTHEVPYNHSREEEEDMPVNIEKHIYRIYEDNRIGGIIKSRTIHHAYNRDRKIEIFTQPTFDMLDFFLQKEFKNGMNGTYSYENMNFTWISAYDKNQKAMRINITSNSSTELSLWIKNGYPFPYQIFIQTEEGNKLNKYTYILKKFKKGSSTNSYVLDDVHYNSTRNVDFYDWKDLKAPWHGTGSSLNMDIQIAMVESHNYLNTYYPELKTFINNYPDYYITYAQYWDSNSEAGWNLHFGHKNLQKDYVLNVSNSGTNPIPSRVLNQKYLPYREIPKDIDNISDQLLSIADAEIIFQELVAYSQVNHTFEISFIEDYYPDTLFDIWEGNNKEKEISDRSESRGATLINGYHGIVKDYEFGYWLTIPAPPLEEFHWKINGENGKLTYIYEEY